MASPIATYDAAFRQDLKDRRASTTILGGAADGEAPILGQAVPPIPIADLGRRIEQMAASGSGLSARDLERYLGRNDLLRVNYLERGLLAARAVARLRVAAPFGGGGEWGTGFLVGPRLLLTNHHVIGSPDEAARTVAEFGYEADAGGRLRQGVRFRCAPQDGFLTDVALDVTLVALEATAEDGVSALADFGFLRLTPTVGKIDEQEYISLIQHPGGDEKYIAIRENRLIKKGDATSAELDNFLWYASDTAPGSSGAPAFNDSWQVVAIHHRGVAEASEEDGVTRYRLVTGEWVAREIAERLPDSQVSWIANEGVRVSKVVAGLADLHTAQGEAGSALIQDFLDDAHGIRPFPGTIPRESIVSPALTLPPAAKAEAGATPVAAPATLIPAPPPTVAAPPSRVDPGQQRERGGILTHSLAFYDGRQGYDPAFLDLPVPLPTLTSVALRFGQIAPVSDSADGVLRYTHFSLVMNAARRIAFFTAVNIDGARWVNLERARDQWYYDPRLAREHQLGDEFYGNEPGRKGWFDRGHLVRRLDPVWGSIETASLANDDSFHFTNAAPQYWGFNQGEELWQGLENFILYNTDAEDVRATVFSGPVFQADDELHRGVQIPQYFWKVVVVRDGQGALSSSAYVVSQQRYARNIPFERLPVGEFQTFQVPVARLEERTGLLFGDVIRSADVSRTTGSDRPLRGLGDVAHPRRSR